jgi:phospho-N-acetylmuramoyl-pentapeptide-transferase
MMTDTLVVLVIISLPFLIEMLSSAIQIASKKLRHGKKVFLIAPFHHHLQKLGWNEETIVMRFWLIGIVISSLALIVNAALR